MIERFDEYCFWKPINLNKIQGINGKKPAYNMQAFIWGGWWGSNPRQLESQSRALPTELQPPLTFGTPDRNRTCNPRLRRSVLYPVELRALMPIRAGWLVGAVGFELTTLCSQSRCANRAALRPDWRMGIYRYAEILSIQFEIIFLFSKLSVYFYLKFNFLPTSYRV